MLTAPTPRGLVLKTPINILKAFVKLREVVEDVACLDLGHKNFDYRGILKVSPINFSLMSEEDQGGVIEGFKALLNGLAFPVQILVRNLPHNLDNYVRTMEAVHGDLENIAHDHAQFVRQLSSRRALVKREYYIIVPSDYQNAKNRPEALLNAQMQIKVRLEELLRQLGRAGGLTAKRLNSAEIVSLYQSCLMPLEARRGPITDAALEGTKGVLVSAFDENSWQGYQNLGMVEREEQEAQIASLVQADLAESEKSNRKSLPANQGMAAFGGVPELVTPSSLEIFPSYIHIEGESEHTYTRTLAIVSYPRSAYPGWFDSIIQVDEPYIDFIIHIEPLPPQIINARLSRKIVEFRGSLLVAQRQGRTADPTTSLALEDIERLREKLARGSERVFSVSALLQVHGQSWRALMERSDRIVSTIRSLDLRALSMHWQHHTGLLSCLPDGNNLLARGRLLGTSAAATFFPFTNSDISMDSGVMFGVHANGGLIIINPFDSHHLENANMVVFAKSGAGKSFFLKTVSCRLLPTCNIYVVDPEAEYDMLCKHVNGQYVRLSSESLQINPFELHGQSSKSSASDQDGKEEGNLFREKLLNLITLLELLLSDDGTLPQKEKAFLYKCLVKTYENRGITIDPATHGRLPPSMQEFFVIMSSALRGDDRFGISEDVYGLSERLERYLHLFPARTHVALNNRFIDFNIRELSESLKPIGLFMITEFLWTKMRQARQTSTLQANTIILIDEAWLLMKFSQGAKFLEEFARRIRKYGGGLWCTTQNSDDFLNSEEGKTILAMATMKFLMKQDSSTIDSVVHTFHLTNGQKNFLLAARRGEGLFSTKTWTQMEVVASPVETALANTTVASMLSQAPAHQASREQEPERAVRRGSSTVSRLAPHTVIDSTTGKRHNEERYEG